MRWQVVNNWNGGKEERIVEFTSKQDGIPGHNECFAWILKHTPFSYYEATTWQGYKIIGIQ